MQTFLPFADFNQSAKVLDRMRLGKQRVEGLQIYNALTGQSKGWVNHPATKMWRGYELALVEYTLIMCNEWRSRGYNDNVTATLLGKLDFESVNLYLLALIGDRKYAMPHWLGDEAFHASHRSALMRKLPDFYNQYGWHDDMEEYVWPV